MTTPLFVDLRGQRVVSIGGGQVAARKLQPLADDGAEVTVVAPRAVPALRQHRWHARAYGGPADLAGAVLVLAATADPATNARVAADAAAQATLCVRVDGNGTAAFGGAVRRGPLTFAVGTDGRAPALARHLREDLEERYGPEWAALAALYAELRTDPAVRAALANLDDAARRARWRSIPVASILSLIRTGQSEQAKEAVSACLSSSSG